MKAADLHPILQDLNAHDALCVLDFLLRNSVLSPEQIQFARTSLQNQNHHNKSKKKSKPTVTVDDTILRTRHVALHLYYDGGTYSGLAESVGCPTDNSIEKHLFAALQTAHLIQTRATSKYSRSGRTDKGVSANRQVVALHLKSAFGKTVSLTNPATGAFTELSDSDLPRNARDTLAVWVPPRKDPRCGTYSRKEVSEYRYDQILNKLLPATIRVLGWTPVSEDFSARFSTASRTYRYFFVPRRLALPKMQEALQFIVGEHDFRNFCKMNVEKVYNFKRVVHSAEVVIEPGNVCYLQIVGQAFLWHQIRCLASILFLVGKELEEPGVFRELLDVDKHPGKPSYDIADERPLVLHDCSYNNLHFGYSSSNLWNLQCGLEKQWEDFALAAARVRNSLESLKDLTVNSSDLISFCQAKLEARQKKGKHNDAVYPAKKSPISTETVNWKDALKWFAVNGLIPGPGQFVDAVYKPLLSRHKGTTYEEKVASLNNSSKRKLRYEENVHKKRLSKEEDASFYDHMTKQGGTSK